MVSNLCLPEATKRSLHPYLRARVTLQASSPRAQTQRVLQTQRIVSELQSMTHRLTDRQCVNQISRFSLSRNASTAAAAGGRLPPMIAVMTTCISLDVAGTIVMLQLHISLYNLQASIQRALSRDLLHCLGLCKNLLKGYPSAASKSLILGTSFSH